MKLFIPTIGHKFILEKPWTFKIQYESRNSTLIDAYTEAGGKPTSVDTNKWGGQIEYYNLTLDAGMEVSVARIYIRQGVKDFDSVTFRAKDPSKKKSKSYRFWVKLEEANKLEYV